ncbi:MAG TPA: cytochrome b/b6 domain-containing protein [Rhizomicrobium sp.]|nr:cytochrome b/b6 domain-containing protein [Rhizomicrobium sp.]
MDHKPHVRVWDIPVRLFHWSMVLLLCLSWFSADQGYMRVHLVSGLTLLALLLFRIAWGLVGSTTARFSNFLHPPRRVVGYLKGLAGGERIFHAGHNPAGGLMVLALIAVLLAQVATGLFANDGVQFHGPLALLVSEDISTRLTDIHGLIFDLLLILVWCHVVAVGFYLLVKGDNLVWPMITGKKHRAHLPEELNIVFTRLYIALLLLAVSAGIAAWIMIQGESIL